MLAATTSSFLRTKLGEVPSEEREAGRRRTAGNFLDPLGAHHRWEAEMGVERPRLI